MIVNILCEDFDVELQQIQSILFRKVENEYILQSCRRIIFSYLSKRTLIKIK